MLEHVGHADLARRLRQVLREDGVRTAGRGGKASTKDFAQAIMDRVSA